MKFKKLHLALLACGSVVCNVASAQLFIDQATFTIQSGATVTVQGNVTSNVDIQGAGKVILKGTANQDVNMNGFTIPNLEVDNAANVTLTGNAKVGTALQFTNGKILLGANNLTLASAATATGGGASKFVETNGAGQLVKELTANVTAFEMPVGAGAAYRPAYVTTNGTYAAANVGVKVLAAAHPNKPSGVSDYIAAYWPITRTGVTGTVTVAGQYTDPTDVSGTEANLRGYFYNGTDWTSTSGTNDVAVNRVGVPVTVNGSVYGMDKFVLVKTKAFLQGAFSTSVTPLMNDNLRAANLLPTSSPYRAAPYSAAAYVSMPANAPVETVATAVFAAQTNTDNNIVDWVWVELRNSTVSPGNAVLQTRSALITKAGNIVDVDGVSPVTFNNTAEGNYTIAVRHRNHLGISANPATYLYAATEKASTTPQQDLTTATAAQIYMGASGAYTVSTNSRNLMWGGNANFNANVKFFNLSNDKDYILTSPRATNLGLGNSTVSLTSVYSPSDLNMNGTVSYLNLNNDKDFLLTRVLLNNATTTFQRVQQLPN
jgi:hypothetical protein